MTAIKRHTEPLFFPPTLSKESFTSWWLWRVLITVLPVGLSSTALGSGSAAQLTSPQGCNHLPHHLLITGTCFDYHPAFNGKPPYDEFHCTQHKRRYKFSVPSRSAAFPFLPSSPWTPRSHHIVQDIMGNKGNVKIKPYNWKGFCAFWFKLLLALCCTSATRYTNLQHWFT